MSNLSNFIKSFENQKEMENQNLFNDKKDELNGDDNTNNNDDCEIKKSEIEKKKIQIKLKPKISENEEKILKIDVDDQNDDKKIKYNNINIDDNNIDNISEENNENDLFIKSETDEKFKEQWLDIYHKALKSNKTTMTNQKIRNGRFRIDSTGKIEILSDFSTYNKTSKILMREKWEI